MFPLARLRLCPLRPRALGFSTSAQRSPAARPETSAAVAAALASGSAHVPDASSLSAPGVVGSTLPSLAPYPADVDFTDFVTRRFAEYGDATAIVDGLGNERTFAELLAHVDGVAGFLQRAGMKRGDTLLLYSPNDVSYFAVAHGVARAGGVTSTANPVYGRAELEYQMEHSGARFVVTSAAGLPAARAAAAARGISDERIWIMDPENAEDARGRGRAALDVACGGHGTVSAMERSGLSPSPLVDRDPARDDFYLPYSSGTTGRPKGVQITHANLVANIMQWTSMEGDDFAADEVVVSPLPSFHCYGFAANLMHPLLHGKKLVTMPAHSLEAFCGLVAEHRATRAYVVPPIMIQLAAGSDCVARHDMSSLRVLTTAAAPCGAETEAAVVAALPGVTVKQAWGMTETSPLASMVPDNATKPLSATVGVLTPDTFARVVRPGDETCAPLPRGEEGELHVAGPQVMKGYLNDAEKTRASFSRDGWLLTGDVARLDEDGYLYITDRTKELIKYKGFQVAPAELEALLLTHPLVADCAVIRRAHPEAGEVPRAYVVRREGSGGRAGDACGPGGVEAAEGGVEAAEGGVEAAEGGVEAADAARDIAAFVEERVAHFKRLRGGVLFVDEIPKTASGKILRRVLYDADVKRVS
jgi:acyl-CoA synthetase (AMP-forming)/AMP-acid ligase II